MSHPSAGTPKAGDSGRRLCGRPLTAAMGTDCWLRKRWNRGISQPSLRFCSNSNPGCSPRSPVVGSTSAWLASSRGGLLKNQYEFVGGQKKRAEKHSRSRAGLNVLSCTTDKFSPRVTGSAGQVLHGAPSAALVQGPCSPRVWSLELRGEKSLQISTRRTNPVPVRDDKLGIVEWAAISSQVILSWATQPLTLDFPNSKYWDIEALTGKGCGIRLWASRRAERGWQSCSCPAGPGLDRGCCHHQQNASDSTCWKMTPFFLKRN